MFRPPMNQSLIIGRLVSNFPIDLRNVIIHPTIVHPHQHIRIEVIVILKAIGFASIRIALLVAVNTERRHTELHPRFTFTHGFVYFLDQHIYIVTTPIRNVTISTTVLGKCRIVRKFFSRIRIRIEIVVHVKGIDVITAHDVTNNLADVLAVFRKPRIEIQLSSILNKELRMLVVRMDRRQSSCSFGLRTIRIDPSMEFHIALVTFVNHPLQRIPLWRLSLYPCKETAPRLIAGLIKGIRFCTHLENNGIDTRLLQCIELRSQHALHGFFRHPLKLSVHTLNPRTAEFTLGCLCLRRHRQRQQTGNHYQ